MIRALMFTMIVLGFGASAQAVDVGFQTGNDFSAVVIRGSVDVSCFDRFNNRQSQTLYCERETLDPVEMAYLATSEPIAADGVTLTVTQADGDQKMKTQPYSSAKMRSTKRFNLWVATLLQRPLLDVGANRVDYRFVKKDATVATGSFTANVTVGQTRYCEHEVIWNAPNCDIDFCQRYFEDQNYCQ